ncbi:MAG: dehydrogenase [candidate division WS6 bacterium GW2011_GWF1_35_23]|uniref:Dehydrogenase n=1 Tax=candidate division WS6 bacterium GW2011_GWF1_35_23 TaxID=1619097 RepID=A0A0G0CNM5_9BACT|nr:MAG: dehydrogenase [candidate division WS6 bacterium GW2011_GWF1_35_23]
MANIDFALITGASGGLGKALSLKLLNEGVKVLGISRTKPEIKNKNFYWQSIDFNFYYRFGNDFSHFLGKCLEEHNVKKMGVALCAGTLGNSEDFAHAKLEKWEEVFRVNVFGNLQMLKVVMPHLLKNQFGRIVFISGGGSTYGFPEFSAYSLSKVAIVREVENLGIELSSKGDFSVVALAPGAMLGDMLDKVMQAGVMPKTTVDIQEPVNFINAFLQSKNQCLNGRFIHVRDNWQKYLLDDNKKFLDEEDENKWLLRRIEK